MHMNRLLTVETGGEEKDFGYFYNEQIVKYSKIIKINAQFIKNEIKATSYSFLIENGVKYSSFISLGLLDCTFH